MKYLLCALLSCFNLSFGNAYTTVFNLVSAYRLILSHLSLKCCNSCLFSTCALLVSFGSNPMRNDLGILSGLIRIESVVSVTCMGELSTSTIGGLSYVAYVDTCYDVVNFSVCFFTCLSKYAICFIIFRCLELSSLKKNQGGDSLT